jgi:hypothetical protein
MSEVKEFLLKVLGTAVVLGAFYGAAAVVRTVEEEVRTCPCPCRE